jgi:ligand-binding sensor domain-containing protein/signal transduction histidine kinase/CheY-like chemotaxis protein
MFRGRRRGAASIALRSHLRSAQHHVFQLGLLLVFCASHLLAQTRAATSVVTLPVVEGKDVRFTHLSTEKGLSESVVDHILQDDQGFMWFGTQDGLDRFDGYEFRNYKHEANNSSLSGSSVTALFKDGSGAIWIGEDQFLDRLDPVTEKIARYRTNPTNPNSLGGNVYGITQGADGQMWLGTSNGLDKLDPATGTFTHYRNDPNDPRSLDSNGLMHDIRFVGFDSSGTLWVETSVGINSFNDKTGEATRYPQLRKRDEYQVQQVYEDRSGTLWIHSREGSGLGTFDRKTGRFVRYAFQTPDSGTPTADRVTTVLQDRNGVVWFGTGGSGLMKLDRRRRVVVRYRNDPGDTESLSNNFVFSLYEDLEGNIWVGTGGGGVNRFPETPSGFIAYHKKAGDKNSLDQNFVLSAFEDSQRVLWIGNDGVLNRVDQQTGQFTFYRHNDADPGSISHGTVLSTVEDHSGTLWFATHRGGLNSFNRRTGRFTAYRHNPGNPNSPSSDVIMRLVLDRTGGVLWLGTDHGVDRFDLKTKRFSHYPGLTEKLAGTRISCMVEDHQGDLWLGTVDGGLHRFNPNTGEYRAYSNNPENPRTLSSNRVNAVYVDRAGVLWVGTQQGLNKFDAEAFTAYDEKDGLPNSTIHGILEDRKGNLWVSTNNGLAKFNPTTKRITSYYASDGVAGSEFNSWGTPFQSPSGEMFFPGVRGLTAVFPDKVVENSYVPPVVLTDLRLFGVSVPVGDHSPLHESIAATNSLILTHAQRIFSFQFSALSYANAERNRYRYKLEGLETKWNDTDSTRRFVTYTTLSPGRYLFRVHGSNDRGVWNESGVSVRIQILPAWWNTWWFRLAAGVLLLALIWLLYYLRVRSIERRNRELTRLYSDLQQSQTDLQSQTRILQSILDSIGDGVTVVDERGEFLLVNPAADKIVGITHTQGDPGQWSEKYGFFLPDQVTPYPALELPLAKAVRGEPTDSVEIFARNPTHPQGALLSVTARPLTDKRGIVHGGVAVFSDITARRRAEVELRQAQKMEAIGRLAGGIAHDFNNILGVVIGHSGLLLSQRESEAAARRRVHEISDAAGRPATLTRQLLVFSRKQALQPTVLNLNRVIMDVESMIRRLIGDDIEVRTLLAPDLENVNADPSQMEQVIINFCVNARDAMPHGGRLTIETKNAEIDEFAASQHSAMTPGRYVRLSVSDTGSGIDKKILPRIFEPFFTTKGPTHGTGLGLATVYGIVKQSGGEIVVYSEPEHGSTFSTYLPVTEQAELGEHVTVPQEVMGGSETILLVEDAAPLRAVIREVLEGLGYKILEAEDAERANQIADQYKDNIGLLLTDLSLPKGSGQAVARALLEKRSELKVLYMSAHPDRVVQPEIQAARTDFLQKPFTQEALAEKLRTLLNSAA